MDCIADRLARVAEAGVGLDFRCAVWRGLAGLAYWTDCWPEVDVRGRITGRIVSDEDGYLNVDDEAMVDADDVSDNGLWEDREDGYVSTLFAVDEPSMHNLYVRALDVVGLGDMLGMTWSVEDLNECDTAWMLQVVCSEQTGEEKVDLGEALSMLKSGHAPRGATPWPCAAEALLAIRRSLKDC